MNHRQEGLSLRKRALKMTRQTHLNSRLQPSQLRSHVLYLPARITASYPSMHASSREQWLWDKYGPLFIFLLRHSVAPLINPLTRYFSIENELCTTPCECDLYSLLLFLRCELRSGLVSPQGQGVYWHTNRRKASRCSPLFFCNNS